MINEPTRNRPQRNLALAELARLRHFTGAARDFWPLFLSAAGQLTGVDKLTLLVRKPASAWQRTLDWPPQSLPSRMLTHYLGQLDALASQAVGESIVVQPLEPTAGATARHFAIGAKVSLSQSQEECVLAAMISEVTEAEASEAALCLALAAPTVESFQINATARQAKSDVEKFASVLDLTASMSGEERFLATALAFCNGLAAQFHCERTSLGWLERGYIRLRAISRTEKFDPQMAAARALEIAMEEAFDQDNEVVWPSGEGATFVVRDHEQFAKEQGAGHVCSLPLRRKNGPVAVVTCERMATGFSETELKQMRLACDLAAPRLADLRLKDQWFGARWAAQIRQHCAKILGPEHTWAKVLSIFTVAALVVVCFLRVPYRVEGDFQLRSDELAYLAAPFDGYIDQAYFRPGDNVTPGVPLVKLKTAELELDEAMASADWNRYQREAEKARAAKALAEMRIFEAMAEQAKARLDLARYRLSQASVQTPFPGVIVEGDLRERLGSPVKTADVLLKVARTDKLYVEAEVNERDIHEILNGKNGEIAFVSRPREKFPVAIVTIEQAAVPKEQANVFLVRCALPRDAQTWWRPGMSGVCKFDAGKRTLLWILTHRTVDFLRMKLWW